MLKTALLVSLLFLAIAAPRSASAASSAPRFDIWNPTILQGPLLTCTGTGNGQIVMSSGVVIPASTPCNNLCDLLSTIINVIYYMMAFVIWIIAPIMFATGGIMYMLAGANPGLESTAKKSITGTVIGVVIVLCSYTIVFLVVGAFTGLNTYIGGFGAQLCSLWQLTNRATLA